MIHVLFIFIYFGIGMVVQYLITGALDVLNPWLWQEIGLGLLAVLVRVFRGRGEPDGALSYPPI
jgi:hypothetical protein